MDAYFCIGYRYPQDRELTIRMEKFASFELAYAEYKRSINLEAAVHMGISYAIIQYVVLMDSKTPSQNID